MDALETWDTPLVGIFSTASSEKVPNGSMPGLSMGEEGGYKGGRWRVRSSWRV